MGYKIIILPYFKKQLKAYIKKYKFLKEFIIKELECFNKDSQINLGSNIYKIRVKSQDIKKGKSKSFRLIILLIEKDGYIVPISAYYKGDKENISKKEINEHLEAILFELYKNV